jgi:hypothetical protein
LSFNVVFSFNWAFCFNEAWVGDYGFSISIDAFFLCSSNLSNFFIKSFYFFSINLSEKSYFLFLINF